MSTVIAVSFILGTVISVGFYILNAIGIYRILKAQERTAPWTAFIPGYSTILIFGRAAGRSELTGWILTITPSLVYSLFESRITLYGAIAFYITVFIYSAYITCTFYDRSPAWLVLYFINAPLFYFLITIPAANYVGPRKTQKNDDEIKEENLFTVPMNPLTQYSPSISGKEYSENLSTTPPSDTFSDNKSSSTVIPLVNSSFLKNSKAVRVPPLKKPPPSSFLLKDDDSNMSAPTKRTPPVL